MNLRLGTRASALARTQSQWVADRLTAATGEPVELVPVSTSGDTDRRPLATIGGTGVFVSALRDALLAGEVDLAVHSAKDLPTEPADGLVIAAFPGREDPRDALCARDGLTLGELPTGSTVGTGSPRRAAQLLALGLGLRVVAIRGNVDTRLAQVSEGRLDAVVLARAGLARLGRLDRVTEVLDPLQMLSAPAQGALAVECCAGSRAAELVAALDDPAARAAVAAERAVLRTLEAGCSAPVGALAEVVEGDDGPELSLRALVAAADGSDVLRNSLVGPVTAPEELGQRLATILLEDGAATLMAVPLPRLEPPPDRGRPTAEQAAGPAAGAAAAPEPDRLAAVRSDPQPGARS